MKPIAFFSKKFTPEETRWNTADRELFAIYLAVRHFHRYLYGRPFTIFSDHEALDYFTSWKLHVCQQLRTTHVLFLQNYTFENVFLRGIDNVAADYMSREELEDSKTLDTESFREFIHLTAEAQPDPETRAMREVREPTKSTKFWEQEQGKDNSIRGEYLTDPEERLNDKMTTDWVSREAPYYSMVEGVVCRIMKEFLPSAREARTWNAVLVPRHLQREMITLYHDAKTSAHTGSNLTFRKMREKFYWEKISKDCETYVKSCRVCNQRKVRKLPFRNLGGRSSLPQGPGETLSIDIQYFNTNDEYKYALTIIGTKSSGRRPKEKDARNAEEQDDNEKRASGDNQKNTPAKVQDTIRIRKNEICNPSRTIRGQLKLDTPDNQPNTRGTKGQ